MLTRSVPGGATPPTMVPSGAGSTPPKPKVDPDTCPSARNSKLPLPELGNSSALISAIHE